MKSPQSILIALGLLLSLSALPALASNAIKTELGFIGSQACSGCHQQQFENWEGSHHDKAMELPTKDSVLGDFNNATFTYNGVTTTFLTKADKYIVRTDGEDGKLTEFTVDYVFGVYPLQQYLLPLSRGRWQALSIAWDARHLSDGGQRWYHLYPEDDLTAEDGLHWTGSYKTWNARCAECHATGFEKNYDPRARRYQSRQAEIGVGCEACHGDGIIKIEMHFLPDVYVQCEICKGARFNRETLEVKYKGKNIAEVLDMTANQGSRFFENIPRISNKLETLRDVGLGYIKLGQSATTLSGGEAQRVKLAKELGKRATGRTIYILDEPTTGLHFADIEKLLEVLQRLVDQGNTILVIEHNLDVIKTADYIIDLGPEGGARGGNIVATGTPEQVALISKSYTGCYLRAYLDL